MRDVHAFLGQVGVEGRRADLEQAVEHGEAGLEPRHAVGPLCVCVCVYVRVRVHVCLTYGWMDGWGLEVTREERIFDAKVHYMGRKVKGNTWAGTQDTHTR